MAEEDAHVDDFSTLFGRLCERLQADGEQVKLSSEFGKLSTDEQRVEFAYKLPTVDSFTGIIPKNKRKSSEESTKARLQGNGCFQHRVFQEALHHYTKSIICAHDESPELALAFANRSAVLFHIDMYCLCLRDIEFAICYGYPSNLMYKLLERKAKCLFKLGKKQDALLVVNGARDAVQNSDLKEPQKEKRLEELSDLTSLSSLQSEKVDSQPQYHMSIPDPIDGFSPNFPSASPGFELTFSPHRGRYPIAARDIDFGEVIVVEEPYAATLLKAYSKTHCDYCLVRVVAPVPCRQCSGVVYCNDACRGSAWNQYHNIECRYLDFILQMNCGLGHLALRMVITAGLNTVLSLRNTPRSNGAPNDLERDSFDAYRSDHYQPAYTLVNHSDERTNGDLFRRTVLSVILVKLLEDGNFFQMTDTRVVSEKDVFCVGSHILRNIMMLPCNAHEVSELNLLEGRIAESKTVEIGSGIYNTLSLINHSCDPSVMRQSYGRKCVARALRFIRKGEEIADNYGALYALSTREERNTHLKSQYYFECDCEACINNWPGYFEIPDQLPALKCSKCGGPLNISSPENTSCDVCGFHSDVTGILVRLKHSSDCYKEALESMLKGDNLIECLPVLLDHLRLLEQTVCRPWREYNDCQEAVKQIYNTTGNCFSP